MIELYGAPGSTFVRKPRIVLTEKGIDFISHPTCPMQDLPESYYNISPLGKIPAIKNGNFCLADSSAICAYLEKIHPLPNLYPTDPQHYAQALWFEEYADTVVFSAIAPCYYETILVPLYRNRAPDKEKINFALTTQLPPVANYLAQELIKRNTPAYLLDNTLSIADISIASVFFNMYQAGFSLDPKRWPELHNYLQFIFDRPSFKDCIADIHAEKNQLITLTDTAF